jgi:hypothetical protein
LLVDAERERDSVFFFSSSTVNFGVRHHAHA